MIGNSGGEIAICAHPVPRGSRPISSPAQRPSASMGGNAQLAEAPGSSRVLGPISRLWQTSRQPKGPMTLVLRGQSGEMIEWFADHLGEVGLLGGLVKAEVLGSVKEGFESLEVHDDQLSCGCHTARPHERRRNRHRTVALPSSPSARPTWSW